MYVSGWDILWLAYMTVIVSLPIVLIAKTAGKEPPHSLVHVTMGITACIGISGFIYKILDTNGFLVNLSAEMYLMIYLAIGILPVILLVLSWVGYYTDMEMIQYNVDAKLKQYLGYYAHSDKNIDVAIGELQTDLDNFKTKIPDDLVERLEKLENVVTEWIDDTAEKGEEPKKLAPSTAK